MESKPASSDGGTETEQGAAAGHSGNSFSASCLGVPAVDPFRSDPVLLTGGEGYRPADGQPRGGACVRDQSGGGGDSVPSRGARKRRNGRIQMGHREKKELAGDREPLSYFSMPTYILRA